MNKQLLSIVFALLVAVGSAGVASSAPAPSPEDSSEPRLDRSDPTVVLASEALAKEFDVPIEEAVDRILAQETQFGLAVQIEEILGESFGGAWVDHADGGVLKVASTDLPRSIEEFDGVEGLVWVEVATSLPKLQANLAKIAGQIEDRQLDAHSAWIDVMGNQLVVETESRDTDAVLVDAERMVDREVKVRVEVFTAPQAMQAECVDTHCDAPLRGGSLIDEIGGNFCTAGFLVTNAFGQERLVTAGHCPFGASNDYRAAQPRTSAWHIIGRRAAVRFNANGDFATLVINNVPGWEPRGIVFVHDSIANNRPTVRDERYPINGVGTSGQVGIGGFLCVTGAVNLNPTRCGQLQSVGQTATYRGVTVNNLGRIGVTVCGGMSGGPVYVARLGFGIALSVRVG